MFRNSWGIVEVAASVKVNAGFAISNLIGIIVSDVHTVLSVPKDALLVRVASGVGTIVKGYHL